MNTTIEIRRRSGIRVFTIATKEDNIALELDSFLLKHTSHHSNFMELIESVGEFLRVTATAIIEDDDGRYSTA